MERTRKNTRLRTWMLGDLDRNKEYRLFMDPETYRWELTELGSLERIVTPGKHPVTGRRVGPRKGAEPAQDGALPASDDPSA